MPILNYSTSISASRTIGEISEILLRGNVRKIVVDYDGNQDAIGVTFSIVHNDLPMFFSLPCNWQGVLNAMTKDRKVPRNKCTREQAIKTSWRIIKDWVEAQMAIIEAEQASLIQVFLPYAVVKDGKTLYEAIQDNPKLLNQ